MKSPLRSTPLLMILPSLLLAILIIGYPIIDLAWTSMQQVSGFGQLRGFAGLANYNQVFNDPLFYASLWRTVIWTVTVVGGTLIVSLPIAIMLNEDFYGRSLARVIIMLPWAISLTMTAVVWRWGLNGRAGLLNATLMDLRRHLRAHRVAGDRPAGVPSRNPGRHPVSIPFTTTIFLGGLSSMPQTPTRRRWSTARRAGTSSGTLPCR